MPDKRTTAVDAVTIVKVQRAVGSRTGDVMVCAAGRDRVQFQRPSGTLLSQMGGRTQAYFLAKWRDGRWRIGARTSDQAW